jgi:hypothetical protein
VDPGGRGRDRALAALLPRRREDLTPPSETGPLRPILHSREPLDGTEQHKKHTYNKLNKQVHGRDDTSKDLLYMISILNWCTCSNHGSSLRDANKLNMC